jgi:hypothetical protein
MEALKRVAVEPAELGRADSANVGFRVEDFVSHAGFES